MPPYHLSSASRALYRVFIAPNLSRPALLQTLAPPTRALAPQKLALNQPFIRTKTYKRKDTKRHALSDTFTFDNAIEANYINFIDANGKFHDNVHIDDAMATFDRTLNHLLLINAGKVDEFGRQDPNNPPTCKVISKIALREKHQKKLDLDRKIAQGNVGTGPSPKNLELNWAIAPGDLKHRMKKLQEFLLQGRKVEVLIGPKRRGRVATPKECEDVLAKVRETVAECKGATEPKAPEGKAGGVMTFIFEGNRSEKDEKNKKTTTQSA